MNSQLTICCNAKLDDAAREFLSAQTITHRLRLDCDNCENAEIAFGQPAPTQILASKNLRWIQLSSAGYMTYDTPEMRAMARDKNLIFTNSSQVYSAPCAQHILAMILADARQLLPSYNDQLMNREWQHKSRRHASYLLNGQTVLLLGMGAIAEYLIALLAPFEMQIIAVRQSGKPFEGVEVVTPESVEEVLPRAEHVVNVLPENSSTLGFMSAARFEKMKPGARFYNVGRGTTVDQNALLHVLQNGHLGAAYLDVTTPEPLPPTHPLWSAPNCYITPHTAGGHHNEQLRLAQHFMRNLRAFENDQPLCDRILENYAAPR
jgi:phosphoglycerate dehydrogenase-like enzyme